MARSKIDGSGTKGVGRSGVSKRAKSGKIMTEESFCMHCGHNKVLTYMGQNSPDFGRSKCCKCKRWVE